MGRSVQPKSGSRGHESWEAGVSHGKKMRQGDRSSLPSMVVPSGNGHSFSPKMFSAPSINCCRTCRGRDDSWGPQFGGVFGRKDDLSLKLHVSIYGSRCMVLI